MLSDVDIGKFYVSDRLGGRKHESKDDLGKNKVKTTVEKQVARRDSLCRFCFLFVWGGTLIL